MVMGVVVGLLGLGETLPTGWAARAVRWAGQGGRPPGAPTGLPAASWMLQLPMRGQLLLLGAHASPVRDYSHAEHAEHL